MECGCPAQKSADIDGVLRTILMFLESQNLNETSKILKLEASRMGYDNLQETMPKVIVLKPSMAEVRKIPVHRKDSPNQVDLPTDNKVSYILESSVYEISDQDTPHCSCCPRSQSVNVFFAGRRHSSDKGNMEFSDCVCSDCTGSGTSVMSSGFADIYLAHFPIPMPTDFTCSEPAVQHYQLSNVENKMSCKSTCSKSAPSSGTGESNEGVCCCTRKAREAFLRSFTMKNEDAALNAYLLDIAFQEEYLRQRKCQCTTCARTITKHQCPYLNPQTVSKPVENGQKQRPVTRDAGVVARCSEKAVVEAEVLTSPAMFSNPCCPGHNKSPIKVAHQTTMQQPETKDQDIEVASSLDNLSAKEMRERLSNLQVENKMLKDAATCLSHILQQHGVGTLAELTLENINCKDFCNLETEPTRDTDDDKKEVVAEPEVVQEPIPPSPLPRKKRKSSPERPQQPIIHIKTPSPRKPTREPEKRQTRSATSSASKRKTHTSPSSHQSSLKKAPVQKPKEEIVVAEINMPEEAKQNNEAPQVENLEHVGGDQECGCDDDANNVDNYPKEVPKDEGNEVVPKEEEKEEPVEVKHEDGLDSVDLDILEMAACAKFKYVQEECPSECCEDEEEKKLRMEEEKKLRMEEEKEMRMEEENKMRMEEERKMRMEEEKKMRMEQEAEKRRNIKKEKKEKKERKDEKRGSSAGSRESSAKSKGVSLMSYEYSKSSKILTESMKALRGSATSPVPNVRVNLKVKRAKTPQSRSKSKDRQSATQKTAPTAKNKKEEHKIKNKKIDTNKTTKELAVNSEVSDTKEVVEDETPPNSTVDENVMDHSESNNQKDTCLESCTNTDQGNLEDTEEKVASTSNTTDMDCLEQVATESCKDGDHSDFEMELSVFVEGAIDVKPEDNKENEPCDCPFRNSKPIKNEHSLKGDTSLTASCTNCEDCPYENITPLDLTISKDKSSSLEVNTCGSCEECNYSDVSIENAALTKVLEDKLKVKENAVKEKVTQRSSTSSRKSGRRSTSDSIGKKERRGSQDKKRISKELREMVEKDILEAAVSPRTEAEEKTLSIESYDDVPEVEVETNAMANRGQIAPVIPRSYTTDDKSSLASVTATYFELDYRKLKKDLVEKDDTTRMLILQALRWRITQSNPERRDSIVGSYIRHDILGLHNDPCRPIFRQLLESCYCGSTTTNADKLQESIARLVNSFASLTLGRDYLCANDDLLVTILLPLVLKNQRSNVKITPTALEHMLATFQKLSLRKKQRIIMISSGLVEFMISFLCENFNNISSYCLEYCTALLMNLCLHKETREICRGVASTVVKLLKDLLGSKHKCAMPYVNGAMYSLLTDKYINKEARTLKLGSVLQSYINKSEGETKIQLEFILKLHKENTDGVEYTCDSNAEPDEEVDLLEPELELDDPVEGHVNGEEFLAIYKRQPRDRTKEHFSCLCRPVTPMQKASEFNEETYKICSVDNCKLVCPSIGEEVELDSGSRKSSDASRRDNQHSTVKIEETVENNRKRKHASIEEDRSNSYLYKQAEQIVNEIEEKVIAYFEKNQNKDSISSSINAERKSVSKEYYSTDEEFVEELLVEGSKCSPECKGKPSKAVSGKKAEKLPQKKPSARMGSGSRRSHTVNESSDEECDCKTRYNKKKQQPNEDVALPRICSKRDEAAKCKKFKSKLPSPVATKRNSKKEMKPVAVQKDLPRKDKRNSSPETQSSQSFEMKNKAPCKLRGCTGKDKFKYLEHMYDKPREVLPENDLHIEYPHKTKKLTSDLCKDIRRTLGKLKDKSSAKSLFEKDPYFKYCKPARFRVSPTISIAKSEPWLPGVVENDCRFSEGIKGTESSQSLFGNFSSHLDRYGYCYNDGFKTSGDLRSSRKYSCSCYRAMKDYIEETMRCMQCACRKNCDDDCPKITSPTIKQLEERFNRKNKGKSRKPSRSHGDDTKLPLLTEVYNVKDYEDVFQSRPKISRTPPSQRDYFF